MTELQLEPKPYRALMPLPGPDVSGAERVVLLDRLKEDLSSAGVDLVEIDSVEVSSESEVSGEMAWALVVVGKAIQADDAA